MADDINEVFPALGKTMGRANLAAIGSAGRFITVPEGEEIIHFDEVSPNLYLVADGACEVKVEAQGKTIRLGRQGYGDWLGKQSFFDIDNKACASVVTLSEVRLFEISRDNFDALSKTDQPAASALVRVLVAAMVSRIRSTNALVEASPHAPGVPGAMLGTPSSPEDRLRLISMAMASLSGIHVAVDDGPKGGDQ